MERSPSEVRRGTFAEAIASSRDRLMRHFAELDARPLSGSLRLAGERYLLVRGASLSRELFQLMGEILGGDAESEGIALDLAYDLANAIGRNDARWFQQRFPESDPLQRFFLGPAHFACTGWGDVELDESSRIEPGPGFLLRYLHRHSFEADVWLEQGQVPPCPVCFMNAGYSAGWTSEAFGQHLSAVELRCRAMGDEACLFVMASPEALPRILEEESRRSPRGPGRPAWKIPDPFLRQRMEKDLLRSREELERRVRERTEELTRLAARLQDEILQREEAERRAIEAARWEAAGQIAGGISHDFNNLMGVVIGEIDRLEARVAPGSPESEALSRIQAGCRAASALSLQLVDFVRPTSVSDWIPEVATVIRETLALLERVLAPTTHLDGRIPDRLGAVPIDPDRLTQILTLLLLDIRNQMPRGGRIVITATRQAEGGSPGQVLLDIRAEEHSLPGPSGRRSSHQGNRYDDLGQAAVRHLLEAVGGTFWTEPPTVPGLHYQVRIPASPDRERDQPGPARGSGEAVLVVEDHLALQRLLHEVIGQAGYDVLSTANPQEALEWIGDPARRLDLLLTDVILPGLNGVDLAVQAVSLRPSLKVLFMSGYPEDHLERAGLEAGRIDLLQKPFSPSDLLREIHRLLERP